MSLDTPEAREVLKKYGGFGYTGFGKDIVPEDYLRFQEENRLKGEAFLTQKRLEFNKILEENPKNTKITNKIEQIWNGLLNGFSKIFQTPPETLDKSTNLNISYPKEMFTLETKTPQEFMKKVVDLFTIKNNLLKESKQTTTTPTTTIISPLTTEKQSSQQPTTTTLEPGFISGLAEGIARDFQIASKIGEKIWGPLPPQKTWEERVFSEKLGYSVGSGLGFMADAYIISAVLGALGVIGKAGLVSKFSSKISSLFKSSSFKNAVEKGLTHYLETLATIEGVSITHDALNDPQRLLNLKEQGIKLGLNSTFVAALLGSGALGEKFLGQVGRVGAVSGMFGAYAFFTAPPEMTTKEKIEYAGIWGLTQGALDLLLGIWNPKSREKVRNEIANKIVDVLNKEFPGTKDFIKSSENLSNRVEDIRAGKDVGLLKQLDGVLSERRIKIPVVEVKDQTFEFPFIKALESGIFQELGRGKGFPEKKGFGDVLIDRVEEALKKSGNKIDHNVKRRVKELKEFANEFYVKPYIALNPDGKIKLNHVIGWRGDTPTAGSFRIEINNLSSKDRDIFAVLSALAHRDALKQFSTLVAFSKGDVPNNIAFNPDGSLNTERLSRLVGVDFKLDGLDGIQSLGIEIRFPKGLNPKAMTKIREYIKSNKLGEGGSFLEDRGYNLVEIWKAPFYEETPTPMENWLKGVENLIKTINNDKRLIYEFGRPKIKIIYGRIGEITSGKPKGRGSYSVDQILDYFNSKYSPLQEAIQNHRERVVLFKEKTNKIIKKTLAKIDDETIKAIKEKVKQEIPVTKNEIDFLKEFGFKEIKPYKLKDLQPLTQEEWWKDLKGIDREVGKQIFSFEDFRELNNFGIFGKEIQTPYEKLSKSDLLAELILEKLIRDNNIKRPILDREGNNIENGMRLIIKKIYGLTGEKAEKIADTLLTGIDLNLRPEREIVPLLEKTGTDIRNLYDAIVDGIFDFLKTGTSKKIGLEDTVFARVKTIEKYKDLQNPSEINKILETFPITGNKNLRSLTEWILGENPELAEIHKKLIEARQLHKIIADELEKTFNMNVNLKTAGNSEVKEVVQNVYERYKPEKFKESQFVDLEYEIAKELFPEAFEETKRLAKEKGIPNITETMKRFLDDFDVVQRAAEKLKKPYMTGYTLDPEKVYFEKSTIGTFLGEYFHAKTGRFLPRFDLSKDNIENFLKIKGIDDMSIKAFFDEAEKALRLSEKLWGKDIKKYKRPERPIEGWGEVLKLISIVGEDKVKEEFPVVYGITKNLFGSEWLEITDLLNRVRLYIGGFANAMSPDASLKEKLDLIGATMAEVERRTERKDFNPKEIANFLKNWERKVDKFVKKEGKFWDIVLKPVKGVISAIDAKIELTKTIDQLTPELKRRLNLPGETNFQFSDLVKIRQVFIENLGNNIKDGKIPAINFDNEVDLGKLFRLMIMPAKWEGGGFDVRGLLEKISSLSDGEITELKRIIVALNHAARKRTIPDYKSPLDSTLKADKSFYITTENEIRVDPQYAHLVEIAEEMKSFYKFLVDNYYRHFYPSLSKADLKKLSENPYYGPLFRDFVLLDKFFEETLPSDYGKIFRLVEGSEVPGEVDPILAFVMTVENLPSRIYNAFFNKFLLSFADRKGIIRLPDGRVIGQVTSSEIPKRKRISDLLKNIEDPETRAYLEKAMGSDIKTWGTDIVWKVWNNYWDTDLIKVRVGDKLYRLDILDKTLKDILVRKYKFDLTSEFKKTFLKFNSYYMQFKRQALTSWNPRFQFWNVFFRDPIRLYFSEWGSMIPWIETIKGFDVIFSKDPVSEGIKKLLKSYEGIFLSKEVQRTAEEIASGLKKEENIDAGFISKTKKLGTLLSDISSAGESISRAGVMKNQLELSLKRKGIEFRSAEEAIKSLNEADWYNALKAGLEATHYWGSRGVPNRFLTRGIWWGNTFSAFFRARLIALKDDLLALFGTTSDYKFSAKYLTKNLIKTGIIGTLIGIWHQLHKDDPEYEGLPDYRKAFFLNIPLVEGWYLPVPLAMPQLILANWVSYKLTHLKKDIAVPEFWKDVIWGGIFNDITNVPQMGTALIPDLLKPIGEIIANYSIYRGDEIEPKYFEVYQVPVSERGRERATLVGKAFSDALNKIGIEISPIKADYLLRSYFALLPEMASSIAETTWNFVSSGKIDPKQEIHFPLVSQIASRFYFSSNADLLKRYYKKTEQFRIAYKKLTKEGKISQDALIYNNFLKFFDKAINIGLQEYRAIDKLNIPQEKKFELQRMIENRIIQWAWQASVFVNGIDQAKRIYQQKMGSEERERFLKEILEEVGQTIEEEEETDEQ